MPDILIADDNPLTLRFFMDAASVLGIESDGVEDGEAAVNLAQQKCYNLLILDWHMPKLDGIGVLKKLRASANGVNVITPAIATSAELTENQRNKLLSAGFSSTLLKPLSIAQLEVALRQFLPNLPESSASKMAVVCPPEVKSLQELPLLEDTQALLASAGDPAILQALRQLFAKELETLPLELKTFVDGSNTGALRDRLHRLSASAGFCGAKQLSSMIENVRPSLSDSAIPAWLENLLDCCQKTRSQILASSSSC